jgi:hypothetical protein
MMSVLDWTTHPFANLKKYAELGKVCFEDVGRFEECDHVWAIARIVLGVICVLALAYIATHFYREYSAHRRVWLRRQAELEVAPPDVMNKYKWSGENALEPGPSHEEIIQRIKEAKALRRGDAASASDDRPGGDPALGAGIRHRKTGFPDIEE